MSKNPSKIDFKQPMYGQGKTTTKKNPSKVGFSQPTPAVGKTSAKKNATNVPFKQKVAPVTGSSTKKNPGKVGFEQPNPAKKNVSMPAASGGVKSPKMAKQTGNPKVAPKFTSLDQVTKYRKKKYGV